MLKPLPLLDKIAKQHLYRLVCATALKFPPLKLSGFLYSSFNSAVKYCVAYVCDMSSNVGNRSVITLKLQLQSVQCRKDHRHENRTFLGIVLIICVRCYCYFTQGFLLVWCVDQFWLAPGVVVSHWRWELKDVAIWGCFACFSKACEGGICCICPCKELECSGRMAAR